MLNKGSKLSDKRKEKNVFIITLKGIICLYWNECYFNGVLAFILLSRLYFESRMRWHSE